MRAALETRLYNLNGIEYFEEMVPKSSVDNVGMVVIAEYVPHSCPWDSYGNKQAIEWQQLMDQHGIECVVLHTRCRNLYPRGSGSGGRLRFGDDMMPGIWRLAVRKHDDQKALAVLEEHKLKVQKWLFEDGPYPFPVV